MGFLSRQPNSNEPDDLNHDRIAKILGSAYKPVESHWTCDRCNYMNAGPVCTHCFKLREEDSGVSRGT